VCCTQVINWRHTLHIPRDAYLSTDTVDLILRLCCCASQRLGRSPGGAAELKSHSFFAGIEFDSLRRQRAPYVPRLRYATDTSNFDAAAAMADSQDARGDSVDSLVTSPMSALTAATTCDGGRHAFLEFTFRRFFDADGHAHATPLTDGPAPIYV